MNVADYSLILATQRVAAGARRDAKSELESHFSLRKLRGAQKTAPGSRVGAESERRLPAAVARRTSRRDAEAADVPTRRDDERGRFLDVYC